MLVVGTEPDALAEVIDRLDGPAGAHQGRAETVVGEEVRRGGGFEGLSELADAVVETPRLRVHRREVDPDLVVGGVDGEGGEEVRGRLP